MELLMNYFKSFKKTAQRIEALSEYNASESNKSFFYYNNGNITEDYSDAGWCKNIKEWVNEGKSIERIRDYNEIYRKLKENTFDIQEIFKIIRNQEFNLY